MDIRRGEGVIVSDEFLKVFTLERVSKRSVFSDLKRNWRLDKMLKHIEKVTFLKIPCTCGLGLHHDADLLKV